MPCSHNEKYRGDHAYTQCIDGYLHCPDFADEEDFSGGEIPCPACNRQEWMSYYRSKIIERGAINARMEFRKSRTLHIGCGAVDGLPRVIFSDKKAMRTIRRWLRRGWYQGKKYDAKQMQVNRP